MDFINPEDAEQTFNEIDTRKQGYLTVNDFRILSEFTNGQFTDADASFIFEQLDLNKDGLVSKDEFVTGFARALNVGDTISGYCGIIRRASSIANLSNSRTNINSPVTISIEENDVEHEIKSKEFATGGDRLDVLPCQEEVLSLYERLQSLLAKPDRLQSTSIPDLLKQYERIVSGVCNELLEQRRQNQRLQELFQKEKVRYSHQIDEVELNLNVTLAQEKERARKEERERLEKEKEQIYQQFENEVSELKDTISILQKTILKENMNENQKKEEFRQKVQELSKDNLRLRRDLTEKQTELIRIQATMAKLRQNFDDKFSDWTAEKEQLVHLTDSMNHQLQLLYDANKQLHDTNDNLRSAIETRQLSRQLTLRTPSPTSSRGRISPRLLPMSKHASWNHSFDTMSNSDIQTGRPAQLGLRRWDAGSVRGPDDSVETDEDIGFSDSGMITRGSNSADSTEDDLQRRSVCRPTWNGCLEENSRLRSLDPSPMDYSIVRTDTLSSTSTGTRSSNDFGTQWKVMEPTGPPERTFRVVIVGDASVGKTSLLMRLVKGDFVEFTSSTIGIEYQNKCLRVDGKNVALQLWDTAGQEKFRSLCRTYLRRADGAILAYDSTCEQSFLNVRYWLDALQESVNRKIPVLLCANKIDLRISAAAEGKRCLSREDGEKLANVHSILFVETSAKDGTNVCDAAVQLTRELLVAEDFEVRSTCVVLEQKKKSSCKGCKN